MTEFKTKFKEGDYVKAVFYRKTNPVNVVGVIISDDFHRWLFGRYEIEVLYVFPQVTFDKYVTLDDDRLSRMSEKEVKQFILQHELQS